MYALVSPSILVKIIGISGILIFSLIWISFGHFDIITFIRITSISAMILGLLLWVIGATDVWRWLWRLGLRYHYFPDFGHLIYPDINGIWAGDIKSNWEIHRARLAMENNKNDALVTFDSISSNSDNKENTNDLIEPKLLAVRIKSNWFKISITMETNDDYSTSKTITVIPLRAQGAGNPKLYYIYQNITRSPQITDSAYHDGAAWFEIIRDPLKMIGLYWTNRNWTQGLNTAGTIDLFLYETDPSKKVDWDKVNNTLKSVQTNRIELN